MHLFLHIGFWAFLRWGNHPQTILSDSTRRVATPSAQEVLLTPSGRGDRAAQSQQQKNFTKFLVILLKSHWFLVVNYNQKPMGFEQNH